MFPKIYCANLWDNIVFRTEYSGPIPPSRKLRLPTIHRGSDRLINGIANDIFACKQAKFVFDPMLL